MNMLSTDQEGDKWVEFKDDQISCLNLETPDDLSHLIVNCLCGESDVVSLEKEEIELLSDLIKNARTEKKINYNQLNELLLLFNQDTIGKDFFVFFFGEMDISLMDLKKGVINFQGFAMLIFGNLKYAYKTLGNKSKTKIESELFPYCRASLEIIREFKKRPNKMLEITKIPKLKTWLAGEVSAGKIESEITLLKKVMEDCPTLQFNNYKLNDFAEWLIKIEKEGKEVQEIARKNTDIYLTWDYMDLYFATSMRVNSEFEETFEFITRVLNDERLKRLSLRYFDPTQSKCGNHIDKGMIEGLMLKRAVCTIYMVQESDTFGKDSELAATLAQKKPVIAYVPKPIVEDYAEKISNSPLDFIRRRILILQAEDVFTEKSCYQSLFEYRKDFRQIIEDFLAKTDDFFEKQPLRMWSESECVVKDEVDFDSLSHILAIAECSRFDQRAKMLKEIHPLAMQVDLESGVSNGVLVVRSPEECAELLYRFLTNRLEFTIKHVEYKDEVRGGKEGYTLLIEDISTSSFRVITDQKRLTNSFWNLFFRSRYNLNTELDNTALGNKLDYKV